MSIEDWVQVAAAGATLALAVAAFSQIATSKRQARASEKATGVSQEALREALRSRIDARSPSVVPLPEPSSRTPLLDRHRKGMPMANDLRLLSAESLHRCEVPTGEYAFPEAEHWFLWFKERAALVNEGPTTARVRLSGEADFVASSTTLLPDLGELPVPAQVGPDGRREYLLSPGSAAVFDWGSGHSLGEWADAHKNPNPPNRNAATFLTVTVTTPAGGGVVDHLYMEAGARPIEPVPGRDGQWRLKEGFDFGVTVYPTQRTYLAESSGPQPPPWAERYATDSTG